MKTSRGPLLRRCLVLAVLATPALTLSGVEWYSCESELSRTRRAAGDAESIASGLSNIQSELDSLKDDYERCRDYPDTLDLSDDGCSSQRYDFNSKVDEYNSRLSDLSSELDDLVRRVRNALGECGA